MLIWDWHEQEVDLHVDIMNYILVMKGRHHREHNVELQVKYGLIQLSS